MLCYYCGNRITIESLYDFEGSEDDVESVDDIDLTLMGLQCMCECGFCGPICENADDAIEAHRLMYDVVQRLCDENGIQSSDR